MSTERERDITRKDFCELLERNGFAGAASDIAAGADPYESTRYMVGLPIGGPDDGPGFYDDAEGRWLADFVAAMTTGYRFAERGTTSVGPFPPGTRVRLVHDVDRYPHFIAPAGAYGRVVDIDPGTFAVRLEEPVPGAEDWDNEVHWYYENAGDDATGAVELAPPIRYAVVRAASQREVEAYLPDNYKVVFAATGTPDGKQDFVVAGEDEAGWTLDGYVLPRLASGNLIGREYRTRDRAFDAASAAMN